MEKEKLLLLFIILFFPNKVDTAEGVRHCRDDQHEVHKGNQFVSCRDCPSCAKGFGLTTPCGNIIDIDTVVECKECLLGATYSEYHGTDSCHPCTVCSPDQVIKTECTLTSNRECDVKCKSQHKYYASKVKHDCQDCSWCCGTSSDERQQECIDKGMPKNKQCSIDQAERCRPSTTPPQATTKKNDQLVISPKPKLQWKTVTTLMPTKLTLPSEASSSSSDTDGSGGGGKAGDSSASNDISLSWKLPLGLLLVPAVALVSLIVGRKVLCKCCPLNSSTEEIRKAEEGQSMEMESTLAHVDDYEVGGIQRETQSDIRPEERCHGSNPEYRAVERQGSVDGEVRPRQLHKAVAKWNREQQSTQELVNESNDCCKEEEIGIEASHEAKSTTQLDKRRLSELFTVAEFMDICQLLECKPDTLSPCGDYKDVAAHYSMPHHSICALERGNEGPAHALITWLMARLPRLTVEEFAVPLTTKKINRPDIVTILGKYYYCN